MATKIDKWQSDLGMLYETEVECLRAEVRYYKQQYKELILELDKLNAKLVKGIDHSSYGSSGGGGHD